MCVPTLECQPPAYPHHNALLTRRVAAAAQHVAEGLLHPTLVLARVLQLPVHVPVPVWHLNLSSDGEVPKCPTVDEIEQHRVECLDFCEGRYMFGSKKAIAKAKDDKQKEAIIVLMNHVRDDFSKEVTRLEAVYTCYHIHEHFNNMGTLANQ